MRFEQEHIIETSKYVENIGNVTYFSILLDNGQEALVATVVHDVACRGGMPEIHYPGVRGRELADYAEAVRRASAKAESLYWRTRLERVAEAVRKEIESCTL